MVPSSVQIDSIGSARSEGGGGGGGDSEVQRTMLELLNQLDGFEPTQNIKVCWARDMLSAPLQRNLSLNITTDTKCTRRL